MEAGDGSEIDAGPRKMSAKHAPVNQEFRTKAQHHSLRHPKRPQ